MYGAKGGPVRRWVIRTEFFFGLIGCVALGVLSLALRHGSVGWVAFGVWLIGVGLNYLPLAVYAARLYPPGRLESELAGVDLRAALRRYSVLQFWLFVPLALVIMDGRLRAERRRTLPPAAPGEERDS